MAKIILNKGLDESTILWRYVSLDKLIHLLETESLYFTPLSCYKETDPFEGYMPKVAFEALGTAMQPISSDLISRCIDMIDRVIKLEDKYGSTEETKKFLAGIEDLVDQEPQRFNEHYKGVIQNFTVSCWHENKTESEAMWKLYSDQGKGVAIKTSVQSIVNGIECFDELIDINMGAVKYMDFFDSNIDPNDCVLDGHLAPLLKRSSYSHESEVRMFHFKESDNVSPEPLTIQVAPHLLIEEVYISPFCSEPFISSTVAICKKYNIPKDRIIKSSLLSGHDELLKSVFAGRN